MRFELTDGCPSAVFKTAGLNRSPKSPGGKARILADCGCLFLQHAPRLDELDHLGHTCLGFEVGHHEGFQVPLGAGAHALGVYDFQKRSSLIEVSEAGAQTLGQIASVLAHGEGLQAHARAAEMRLR